MGVESEKIHSLHNLINTKYSQIKTKLNVEEVSVPFNEVNMSVQLPVLMYHHLDEEIANEQTIPINRFEKHMSALSKNDYTTVSLMQILEYIYYGKALPENPILITFDDGYTSNYEYAFPILKEYGMKAVFLLLDHLWEKTIIKIMKRYSVHGNMEVQELYPDNR